MLKMRLQRVGRRNNPAYRVVVTDSRTGPKSNKHVDLLGSYSPQADRVQIDGEKAKEWIAKGVQLSDTVHNILVGEGVIEGKKINVLPKKSPIVKESEETTEAPAETAETTESEESKEESAEEATPAESDTSEEPTAEAPADEKKEEVESEAKEETVEEAPEEKPTESGAEEEEKKE